MARGQWLVASRRRVRREPDHRGKISERAMTECVKMKRLLCNEEKEKKGAPTMSGYLAMFMKTSKLLLESGDVIENKCG